VTSHVNKDDGGVNDLNSFIDRQINLDLDSLTLSAILNMAAIFKPNLIIRYFSI
jgi:hypothetical protein